MTDLSDITIRHAGEQDADVILKLSWDFSIEEGDADFYRFRKEDYLSHICGPGAFVTVLLAEVESTPAGYTMFHPAFAMPEGCPGVALEDIFVVRAFRGRGIGRALMAASARAGLDFGAQWMSWNVMPQNENARAFYQRLGAKQGKYLPHALVGEAFNRLATSKM